MDRRRRRRPRASSNRHRARPRVAPDRSVDPGGHDAHDDDHLHDARAPTCTSATCRATRPTGWSGRWSSPATDAARRARRPRSRLRPPAMLAGMRPLPAPFDAIAAGRTATIALAGTGAPRQPAADQGPGVLRGRARRVRAARPAAGPRPDDRGAGRPRARAHPAQGRRARAATSAWPRSRTATRRCSTGCWRSTSRSSCRSSTRRRSGGRARSSATSSGGRAARGSRRPTATGSRSCCARARTTDVRLIVVTDNERILGLGDQGAGGMAIPIGKLALYTAACGIHPALTLPVSLDVGHGQPGPARRPAVPRLSRAAAARRRVRRARRGVRRRAWPRCGPAASSSGRTSSSSNALRILDRYRDRVPSFNDDIQGTAAVVVAGRHLRRCARSDRPRGRGADRARRRRRRRDRDRAAAPDRCCAEEGVPR